MVKKCKKGFEKKGNKCIKKQKVMKVKDLMIKLMDHDKNKKVTLYNKEFDTYVDVIGTSESLTKNRVTIEGEDY